MDKDIKTFKVKFMNDWNEKAKKGSVFNACYWWRQQPTNNKSPYIHIIELEDWYSHNNCSVNDVKIIDVEIYDYKSLPYVVNFKVTDKDNNVTYQSIEPNDLSYKVIINGNRTIVILENGCKGVAKCSPGDRYDMDKGINIAYRRAFIKHFQKELKNLIK